MVPMFRWASTSFQTELVPRHRQILRLAARMETNPTGLGGILIVAAVLVLAREELRAARAVA